MSGHNNEQKQQMLHVAVALFEGSMSLKHAYHDWKHEKFLWACVHLAVSGFAWGVIGGILAFVPLLNFISPLLLLASFSMFWSGVILFVGLGCFRLYQRFFNK
jgi:hypothetical protein